MPDFFKIFSTTISHVLTMSWLRSMRCQGDRDNPFPTPASGRMLPTKLGMEWSQHWGGASNGGVFIMQ